MLIEHQNSWMMTINSPSIIHQFLKCIFEFGVTLFILVVEGKPWHMLFVSMKNFLDLIFPLGVKKNVYS